MLKIRYNLATKQLSGWTDNEAEFDLLVAREGEATVILDIPKPVADDYEYFAYDGTELVSSGKQLLTPRRDIWAEIDKIKAKMAAHQFIVPPYCTTTTKRLQNIEQFLKGVHPR